jgi:CheY-like chemotaxis protein
MEKNKILLVEDEYRIYHFLNKELKGKLNIIDFEESKGSQKWKKALNGDYLKYIKEKFLENHENLRAVVCDYELYSDEKGLNGIHVIRKIREIEKEKNLKKTPIIFYSSTSDIDIVEKAREAGADYNLMKNPKELSQLLFSL